ncbi:MAG: hypothetical protein GY861_11820 [bacterium]|nr:hypothetical protein [bacterium]
MFKEWMEKKGYSYNDFDRCEEMDLLIEEYASISHTHELDEVTLRCKQKCNLSKDNSCCWDCMNSEDCDEKCPEHYNGIKNEDCEHSSDFI